MDENGIKAFQRELREKKQKAVIVLGKLRFYACPITWFTYETHQIIRALMLIESSNVLLWAGGWADQPYWLVQAHELYGQMRAEWQSKAK